MLLFILSLGISSICFSDTQKASQNKKTPKPLCRMDHSLPTVRTICVPPAVVHVCFAFSIL